jgi:membrane protease subunit HflC
MSDVCTVDPSALGVTAFLFSSFLFKVDETQYAVMFRFGEIVKTDFEPGLHFMLPVVNQVKKYDDRVLNLENRSESFLTGEKKNLRVDFFVKWRIADVSKFYTASSGDEQVAQQRLSPIVRKGLGKEINARLLQDVVSVERSNVMHKLLTTANVADAYYDEWRGRVEIRRPPRNEVWGARTFDVIDPFGNTIFVMGPSTA